jgi:CBS domain containing-hemolysin-like protein
MSSDVILSVFVIALVVLANSFFVAAEFALVRVRRTRIDALVARGSVPAKLVKDALDHIDDYISATQVGITLASLALGWLGEPFVAHWLEKLFVLLIPATVAKVSAHGAAIVIGFMFISFLHVVVGELMPKSLALQYPERMALWIARPMHFFAFLFRPFIWTLNGTANGLLRVFGVRPSQSHGHALSEEELLLVLSDSRKAGWISEHEHWMLRRVFRFHDKAVREIMVPRPDIVALDLRASVDQIHAAFREGYSRLPVYDSTLNNIKGLVYVKDLIYALRDPTLIKIVDLLRETMFVPEGKLVAELLRELQKNRTHMAIVVDEFGDTAGLVTMEDIIEEIVGEIQDEYDVEPSQVEKMADGSVVFDGQTALDRFHETFPGYTPPDGSFETVAGLVFQIAGRVPKEQDSLRHGGLVFKVIKRDGRRLRRILVRRETPSGAVTETGRIETAASGAEHIGDQSAG